MPFHPRTCFRHPAPPRFEKLRGNRLRPQRLIGKVRAAIGDDVLERPQHLAHRTAALDRFIARAETLLHH